MKMMRCQRGFTLVEIMIVVAIIGLLAAIAIPNLLRARINANDGAVQGDLRAFSTAMESYRGAQNPPTYPSTFALLTGATPSYIDATWTGNPIKHGHTITFAPSAAVGGVVGSYTLQAATRVNEAARAYCVDHTGVLRTNGNSSTAVQTATVGGTPSECTGTAVT